MTLKRFEPWCSPLDSLTLLLLLLLLLLCGPKETCGVSSTQEDDNDNDDDDDDDEDDDEDGEVDVDKDCAMLLALLAHLIASSFWLALVLLIGLAR